MKKNLTDIAIQNLKPSREGKRIEVSDATPGLVMRVAPNGKKSWSVTYKVPGEGGYHPTTGRPLTGKQHRITLGNWPRVSLKEARDQARQIVSRAEEGHDPRSDRLAAARATYGAQSNTVKSIGEQMIEVKKQTVKSWPKIESNLRLHVYPTLGHHPMEHVTRKQVNEMLDKQKPTVQRESLKHMSSLWGFALGRDLVKENIIQSLGRSALPDNARTRVLTDKELAAVWKATFEMGYPYGHAVRMLMLTGCRMREITEAHWDELDEERKVLIVPPERFKTNKAHHVPLTTSAWDTIQDMPKFRRKFMFSTKGGDMPINSATYMRKLLSDHLPKDMKHFTTHDLRRTLRTRLPALEVSEAVAEAAIGHGPGGIAKVYNQYAYETEKREALQAYDDFLQGLVA